MSADALMVTSSFLPGRGGIESYLAELASLAAPRVAVMATATRDGKPLPTGLRYETIPGPGSMLVPTRRVADAVIATARSVGTKRVLFGTPWPLALVGPRLRDAGLRYAVIVHASEMLVPAALPLIRSRLASSLAGAEVLFAVSDFTAAQIERFLLSRARPVPPIERLRARVDLERFRPEAGTAAIRSRYGIGLDQKVVLCFGRLVRRKGVHRLLEAAPEIAAAAGRVTFVVAGTGPEEKKLRRIAARTDASVVFTGRVPEEDAGALYATADVFALPVVDRYLGLETEGLGVVLLEASACGVPCVTGRSGGTTEAVIDGSTGYVIDASRSEQLVHAIVTLLNDPERAARMGRAGREHVRRHFPSTEPPPALLRWLAG